ncbi:MAG TPA: hypothetical protein VHA82_02095 [Ramlibacter sp.]|nr:hypothetical protein [Ramlibacter sp.]HVZ42572.1 hypothetical protein [Ramlibacter sp.]
MMKPLWTKMLAWIAAIAIAVLLALAGPDSGDPNLSEPLPQGATAPR